MPRCYEFNYTSNQPQPLSDVWIQCPVGENCCIGTDLCLSNNICHYVGNSTSKQKRENFFSSYYNARCTDPTYSSPACDKICIGSPPDIVYDYPRQRWACCGNNSAGYVSCDNPLDEYYEAPPPISLSTLSIGAAFVSTATLTPWAQYVATAVTTSSPNITGTGSSSTTSSSTSSSSKSGSLSTGAAAGVGVSVAVAVVVILAVLLYFLRRRRQRPKSGTIAMEMPDTQNRPPVEKDAQPPERHRLVYEMGEGTEVSEIYTRTN